jgi:hypothetical protein
MILSYSRTPSGIVLRLCPITPSLSRRRPPQSTEKKIDSYSSQLEPAQL